MPGSLLSEYVCVCNVFMFAIFNTIDEHVQAVDMSCFVMVAHTFKQLQTPSFRVSQC